MRNHSILIIGAGSLGTALIEQLIPSHYNSIRVLDSSEHALYEAKNHFSSPKLRLLLGDVRDADRLNMAMADIGDVILCAAVKSIDIALANPMETVSVNVFGTFAVIREAYHSKPKRVLVLSSDKGVLGHGMGVYHASKYIVEAVTRWANFHSSHTRFSCVRPANFVPSDMSFTETWFRAYREGKEIPVTGSEVTRYFIPIDKAADYTLRALRAMQGGEIFVPPAHKENMLSLAKRLKRPIKIIGLRPNDRLSEELLSPEEKKQARKVSGMWVIKG